MDFFQDKQDKAHELRLMEKQLENQKVLGAQKLQMTHVEADIRETETLHKEHAKITTKSSQWCINLSASVRPVITYGIFLEFVALSVAVNMGWIDISQYKNIWTDEMGGLWAAVLSFWFGQRSFNRK